MNILIIEDNQNKLRQIQELLFSVYSNFNITCKFSYQSGLKELVEGNYTIAILDMTLPTYDISPSEDGGRLRVYGGKEILRQIARKNIIVKTIIVTQFDRFGETNNTISLNKLIEELDDEYSDINLGAVYFNSAVNNWKDELISIIMSYLGETEC